ncbi:MAG: hypothetical protein FJ333_10490 [Sphingomonadales bacterium]|nr:hypothetical protein [Sphingomonadales bacterium]
MKTPYKLGLIALLLLTISSCDMWFNEDYRFKILQILQNNQSNRVYNKTVVSYGGYNYNSVYVRDTQTFYRNIQSGDTAQILMENMYTVNLYALDTVQFDIELTDSQQFNTKFTRTYIRNPYQTLNDFVETIRF